MTNGRQTTIQWWSISRRRLNADIEPFVNTVLVSFRRQDGLQGQDNEMIWNIVDRRKRIYREQRINAIIEDVSQDNSCDDADQFEEENSSASV